MSVVFLRHPEGQFDPELLWGSVLGTCGLLGFTWLRLGLPLPSCLFHTVTGLPCLTCGGTRAARALAHGDLSAAFAFNPLVALTALGVTLYVLYAGVAVVFRTKRLRLKLDHPAEANWLRWAVLFCLALNWTYVALS